jgi:hypothetical protein
VRNEQESTMSSYPDPLTELPSVEQLMAWPAAWWAFWWALQLEGLRELTTLEVPPWIAWYNGTEQLA